MQAPLGETILSIDVPQDYLATADSAGITLAMRDGERRRVLTEMRVRISPDGGTGPSPDKDEWIGGRRIAYRITRADGGSGGDAIILDARTRCATGFVHLRLDTQAEDGDTSYLGRAWAVLSSASCRPAPVRREPEPAPRQDQPTISSGLKK